MQAESPTLPPEALLMRLGTGYWTSQTLAVAARTEMLEQLLDGPLPAGQVAQKAGLQAEPTERVLRGCAVAEVTRELETGVFELTDLGRALTRNHPRSMRDAIIMLGDPGHWLPWGHLEHTVRSGEAAYRKALGVENVFHYFDARPEEAERFHRSMLSMTGAFIAQLESAYDFTPYQTIADIGGGHGLLLGSVLRWAPRSRGVLFDQPDVVDGASEQLKSLGVVDRVSRVGGSFFESIPAGADLYMMKHILHDWNDEQCQTILDNLRKVIEPSARLLVMDCLLADPPATSEAALMDLNMMVMTGGRERRQSDFAAMFTRSRFQLTQVVRLPGLAQLIEAAPV
jgi:hypothetical protein